MFPYNQPKPVYGKLYRTNKVSSTNKQTARKVREILKSKKDPSTKCNVLTWFRSYNTYEIRKFEH